MVTLNSGSLRDRAPLLWDLRSVTFHLLEKDPLVESGERGEGSGFLSS